MKLRKCEILKDTNWSEIKFEDLKLDNIFRLFEPNGEMVVGNNKDTEFKCLSDAYTNKDGILTVDIAE